MLVATHPGDVGGADVCADLNKAEQIQATVSSTHSPCFLLIVPSGGAIRLTVPQPADLTVVASRGQTSAVFDGFEFGPETATLTEAGEYRIELRTAGKQRLPPVNTLISRETVLLPEAEAWRGAEASAAKSKESGKFDDIEESLLLWSAIGDKSCIARTELKKGDASLTAGNAQAGSGFYESALALCQETKDWRCIAEAANNSGLTAQTLGDFDLSLSRLTQAADAFRRTGDRSLEGETLSNLGLLFRRSGQYQQAIAAYEHAGRVLRPLEARAFAKVLNNLGVCYQYLEKNERARSYFLRALEEFIRQKSPGDAARARLNLGRTYMAEGNTGLAARTFDTALAEAAQRSDRSARADILHNIGQLRIAQHRPADAKPLLTESLELHRALHDRRMESFDLHHLGISESQTGDAAGARADLLKGLYIRLEIGLRDAEVDSFTALAELERTANNTVAARDYAEKGLKAAEAVRAKVPGPELRASYYARRRKLFDVLVELDAAESEKNAAEAGLLAAERVRGRSLLDLLTEGPIAESAAPELLQRLKTTDKQIDQLTLRLASASQESARELRRQVEDLSAEKEEAAAAIHQRLPAAKMARPLSTASEVQRCLPADTGILEYYLGERESYLWLVRSGGDIRMFRLPGRNAIEAQVAPVLRLFPLAAERKRDPEKQRAFDSAMRRLSRTLLGSLPDADLPARLIVVPDGALSNLPFAALQMTGSRRLGLTHDLIESTSASYLIAGRAPRGTDTFPKAFLALTDPVFSARDPRVHGSPRSSGADAFPDLPRLPFSEEIDAATALVAPPRRQVLRGFQASPAALRKASPRDFAVVHLSTHALIDDRNPELSRIVLSMVGPSGKPAEGLVGISQLSSLPLDGSLVVLSACRTALGKQVLGEGLAGFTSAIFQAGASQTVLALSDVDAEASSEFLAVTYKQLFGSNHATPEHSLTLARRALASSTRWSDPWYWASFTIYGRPSPAP